MQDGNLRTAIPCEECHVVPVDIDDPGHLPEDESDDRAEVVFGELARTGNVNPTWSHENTRCTNTYCHGATLSGGNQVEPIWTVVDGTQSACDSCHGNPPPAPHNNRTDCALCHPGTVDDSGEIIVSGGLHINGVVDSDVACNACHGTRDDGAPPPALNGSTDTTYMGVGAHDEHMIGGRFTNGVECSECHIVPVNVNDPGHIDDDDGIAEVTFGPLASEDGSNPVWNRGFPDPTCTGVYCHGASLSPGGGTLTEPIWTKVDRTQAYCGSCHANPPPDHPPVNNCTNCHAFSFETHVDGEVTFNF
jgi:predicted CxxxxCH...CXXCH cytochrome family protein